MVDPEDLEGRHGRVLHASEQSETLRPRSVQAILTLKNRRSSQRGQRQADDFARQCTEESTWHSCKG